MKEIGLDIDDYKDISKNKGVKGAKIVTKGMDISFKIIFTAIVLFFIFSLAYVYFWARPAFETLDVDLEGTISGMHQIQLITVSKETDKKGNGSYVFAVKGREDIQFYATKKYGKMTENYDAECMKYYFDRWNSEAKKKFKFEEDTSNELPYYNVYIEISDYKDVETAVKDIYEFTISTEGRFSPSWNIYIKHGEFRIYPFYKTSITLEEAITDAQRKYTELKK